MDKSSKVTGSKQNDLLMQSLSKFYSTKNNVHKIIPIINGESDISLRLIDWFITNYSKKNQTIITKKLANNNVIHLNVYLSYRSQLKSYSKTYFDPFRRRDRIKFYYDDRKGILETTIGQLNMFRWILQSDILEYVTEYKKDIEQDMIQTQKDNQQRKLNKDNMKVKLVETENGVVTKTRKKRNELSKSVLKNMSQLTGKRTIQFD
jgi:hypothetical protein